MPTLLTWEYQGGGDGSDDAARRGEQRVYPGDRVMDDVLGLGVAVSMDGPSLLVEFAHANMDSSTGRKEVKLRTAGHIRAIASRDPRPTREATGRPGRTQVNILQMLRPVDSAPRETKAPESARPIIHMASNSKGLGRPVSRTAVPRASNSTTGTSPGSAAEHSMEVDGDETQPAGALCFLSAYLASSSEDEGEKDLLGERGKRKRSSVGFRELTDEAKVEYRRKQYKDRKKVNQVWLPASLTYLTCCQH